jgi:amino acid adenylation domain-containing protein
MTPIQALFRSAHADDNGFSPRAGFCPFDPSDAESTLGARFREIARQRESATAVVDGDTHISYAELLQRAEAIANNLRSRCGSAGGVVAICLTSRMATIEAMLGAILGEFAYFCLDPSLPLEQRVRLLGAAAPVTLLGGESDVDYRSDFPGSVNTRGPGGVAALYATSGSTGEPKMVALSHRAILFDIGRQTNDLYLGSDDRFDSLFSFAFSASLATNFGALLNGAELHCYDPQHNFSGLPAWLAERRITISTMTVSMLRHICLLKPRANTFSEMRLLSVGGEALHSADVDAFRSAFPPSCVLQNAMAATETRTYAQYFVPLSGPVESPVPIGWPVAGKEVLLLDEDGAPVPRGAEGEIAIQSRYLADGYLNDPQHSAKKFHPRPDGTTLYRTGDRGSFRPDGSLHFLGRTDSQAKIRGHRVELDHIAQVIELHPQIRTAVVVTCQDPDGNDRLVAYVVPRPDCHVSQTRLRDFLPERLPEYALPSNIVFLSELPLNANFKVDRRRLPSPMKANEDGAPADGETIEVLRGIWKSVLQCSHITDDESFADLGGDSLSAVRVLVAIHERFQCDLPPDSLHFFPTLRLLADRVNGTMQGDASAESVFVFKPGGRGFPIFFVAGLGGSSAGYQHLAEQIDSSHPVFGLNIRTGFAAIPGVSVESIAANHVAEIERIVPRGQKVVLVGYSFGGTIAFEIAVQLRKRGLLDPLPIVIDMTAVNVPGHQPRTLPQRLLDALRNLPAWTTREIAHFRPRAFFLRIRGHVSSIAGELRLRPASDELDPRIYFGESNLPKTYQAFLTSMYRALLAYVPKEFDGRMVVLRAKVPTLFRSRNLAMGWQSVAARGVEVYSIPGRHDDCLSKQHSPELASVLMQCAVGIESTDRELVS